MNLCHTMHTSPPRSLCVWLAVALTVLGGCGRKQSEKIIVGSKFFTEQVLLAELLAQHIEARTGIPVERKTNLGGTLLVQKAMQAGELDLYVEYTGTALTAVLNETPTDDSKSVFERVKKEYADRYSFEVTEPLGFENTFAMVIRGEDAKKFNLQKLSDVTALAPKWRAGVGYEFLERPDGFNGLCERYGLKFGEKPRVMDLGLIYRALVDHQVDVVAGNSTDGLISALGLVALEDNRHYFPPYDAVPIVRKATLERFPTLRGALTELAGRVSAADIQQMNYAVDGLHREPAAVVSEFRRAKGL
jgi:osmoprotectant transport system substrate-binding protein